ncbi:MAG: DUF3108 domain-containing protein [Desulfovibrionaceae bacterium]
MRLTPWRALALILALLFPAGTAWADLSALPLPLPETETLRYEITWKSIYVGYATLETHEIPALATRLAPPSLNAAASAPDHAAQGAWASQRDAPPVRRFLMTVRTNPFVDMFFTVRNRIESETDAAMNASRYYRKTVREGGTRRDFEVFYESGARVARFLPHTDTLFPDAAPGRTRILPDTFDPLAVFYALRTRPFPANGALQAPVSDGRRFDYVLAVDRGAASVATAAGTFACREVEVRMQGIDGILRTSGPHSFTIWITDTPRRLPVAVESTAHIGPFSGVLRVALKALP